MDLFRFKLEDRQLLPSQGIGGNLVQQSATNRYDERLISEPRVNAVALFLPKRDSGKRLLTGFCFSSVLRSERAESHLYLRLIEAVFWETRSNVFHEPYYPLIL